MKKYKAFKKFNLKFLIVLISVVYALMLVIEVGIQVNSNRKNAYKTTNLLVEQARVIIKNNEERQEALVLSLKEDYINRAKTISYIIDHNPDIHTNQDELLRLAEMEQVDEIHLFDASGVIYTSTVSKYVGYSFNDGEQISFFKPMLDDKTLTMCQDITPNTAEAKSMMYAICWNFDGTFMVQVGIEPKRLIAEMHSTEITEIIGGMAVYESTTIMAADIKTGEILGSTKKEQEGKKLSEIGIDFTESSIDGKSTSPMTKEELSEIHNFPTSVEKEYSYCSACFYKDDYILCVVIPRSLANRSWVQNLIITGSYLLFASLVIFLIVRRTTNKLVYEHTNATTDPLTGLANRRSYENDIALIEHSDAKDKVIYLSFDLNGLKNTNDTLGHDAGDKLIIGAAECLLDFFGKYGHIYRFGGDEFAAVLLDINGDLEIDFEGFERKMELWSEVNEMTLSVAYGAVRSIEFPDKTIVELSLIADERMYKNKSEHYNKKK